MAKIKPGMYRNSTISLFKGLKKGVIYKNLVDSPLSPMEGVDFQLQNISANLKSKSERPESLCKGPMPNLFMQENRKKRFIAKSLQVLIVNTSNARIRKLRSPYMPTSQPINLKGAQA
jgi:hypothetical protein